MFNLGRDKIELIKSFKGSASVMVIVSHVVNKGKTEDWFCIKLYSYFKFFCGVLCYTFFCPSIDLNNACENQPCSWKRRLCRRYFAKNLSGRAALLLKINYKDVQCCIKLLNANLGGQPLQELVVLCNSL